MQSPEETQPGGNRRETRAAGVRLVGIFVPWQAVALTLGVVVVLTALVTQRGSDPGTVRVEQASTDSGEPRSPTSSSTTPSTDATTTTFPPTSTTEASTTTTTAPTTTTTALPTTTTTQPPASTTTTTLPPPTISLEFEAGSSSARLTYTTPRHYDVSICVEATLQDGSTTQFVNTFRGFAPTDGNFAVMPPQTLHAIVGMELLNFNYATPSYDALPDPCAGH